MAFSMKNIEVIKQWFRDKASRLSLSSKLLVLTIVFIMLAEVLIFVPSVANFRKNWLEDRLSAAQIAALAVEASSSAGRALPEMLQKELLANAQVHTVALRRADSRRLVLTPKGPILIRHTYDLRDPSSWVLIRDAIALMLNPNPGLIRVIGNPQFGAGDMIDIVVDEASCRDAAIYFGLRILGLSIVISIIAAILVYLALNALLVSPMMRLTGNIVHFAENPEDRTRIINPSKRGDEIGTAERELSQMQGQLADMLQQKSRLAALGLAVSKINHDLRNMLANATLISDRMSEIKDPQVQRFTPKLIGSLDRAIRLCQNTLKYGQAPEPTPELETFGLRPLVEDVGESLELVNHDVISFEVDVSPELKLCADQDQVYRILLNLCRNSVQILEADTTKKAHKIGVKAIKNSKNVFIDVFDSGPGVPDKAKEYLFDAFKGSVRKGGTGLGLAISAELVKAHGGELTLLDSNEGAVFRISLPI